MSILIAVVKFLVAIALCNAMTMKQIKSTGKMMRKTCQPKNNVADVKTMAMVFLKLLFIAFLICLKDKKIDPLSEGVFIEEKEVMCYVACIMKMANAVKNNKLNYEAAMKQADLLFPEEIKQPAKDAITACKKVSESYKDICEASFYVTKCIYNHNPAIFYFP